MSKKKKKLTVRQRKWLNQMRAEMMNRRNQRRRELLAQTTPEQRKAFIGKLNEATLASVGAVFSMWNEAKQAAGITNDEVAWEVYRKFSRPSNLRIPVDVEEVK